MNTKKNLKYSENKKVELIDDKNKYNDIGAEEAESFGKVNNTYKTRKVDNQHKDNTQPVKIDENKLAVKKSIAVPETKNDESYYGLIKNKRQTLDQLNGLKGYERCMVEDTLPNPDIYESTDTDLEFLDKLNYKYTPSQHLKQEDFEHIIEVWETEIGQVVNHEKKRNGSCPIDLNKLELEKARTILKESKDPQLLTKEQQQLFKDLVPFTKNNNFNSLVDEVHRVVLEIN